MVNKKKKIKNYEVTLDSEVFAISLVESPAIEMDYVYLAKEESQLVCLEKDEKHLLVGCVLRPDFPIYRYGKGEEYYLQFSKEVIEKLAYEYMQNGRIYSFTTDHKEITDNISVVESWIKTSENDKSNDFGLHAPIGSWLIAAKVEDEEIWQRVKNGELKGFSVESFVNLEEILLNKQEEMENQNLEMVEVNESFWVKIATIIKEALKSPETPELEAQVTAAQVVDEMKQEVENPEETVVEEPIVAEEVVEETPIVEEAPIEETVVEEPIVEEPTEEVIEEPIAVEEPVEDLQVTIDELNKMIDELNQKIADLEKENVKLSKQPSAEPVKINGSNGNSGSNFDRMLAVLDGTAFRK